MVKSRKYRQTEVKVRLREDFTFLVIWVHSSIVQCHLDEYRRDKEGYPDGERERMKNKRN